MPTPRTLRQQCQRFLHGRPHASMASQLRQIADWAEANDAEPDQYGAGGVVEQLESRVASLLGFDAAVLMPSGTMAQQIALRIWADRGGGEHVGMHPTCHLERHEQLAYAHVHRLTRSLLGERERPLLASDLDAGSERMSAVLTELPIREAGGILPTWDQLEALKSKTRAESIRLHMDGARLWESGPFYDRPYHAICSGFDSVYVSLYKGLGAIGGAVLAGDAEFVAEARIWCRRHGGNLVQLYPFAASALMWLDIRLPRMEAYAARARELAAALSALDGVEIIPDPPHTNMMHIRFPGSPEALRAARDHVASNQGLWVFGALPDGPTEGGSTAELYVCEGADEVETAEAVEAVAAVLEFMA